MDLLSCGPDSASQAGEGVTGPGDWDPCLTLQGFHQTRAQSQRLSQAPDMLASSDQSQHRWAIYPQEEKSNTILLGLALWDMVGSFMGSASVSSGCVTNITDRVA